MAEYIANEVQTVAVGSNVLFTDTVVDGADIIRHRPGSGIIKVFPVCKRCYTRYKVTFSGNLSVPTGQTPGAISVAIGIDGEPYAPTTATVTPAAVDELFNVSTSAYVYVRHGCCSTISVTNTSTIPINVTNANIIVTRE